jgi:integrase
MRRDETPGVRVYGPYAEAGGGWRLVVVCQGSRTARRYSSKEEAERDKAALLAQAATLVGTTIEDALDRYELHLRNKGNKETTIGTTLWRLKALLGAEVGAPVGRLTPARAGDLYLAYSSSVAVDTHRNALGQARTFGGWLVKERLLPVNPFAGVVGTGRRSQGKPQLRVDEARRFLEVALEWATVESRYPGERRNHAEGRKAGAVAAASAFLLGLRSGEVIARVVRDLDDGGRMLWIPTSKTRAGQRRVAVPEVLQPYLLALASGKPPDAPLFTHGGGDWVRDWTHRICAEAKVSTVCAHSLRGLHATLAEAAGVTGDAVARSLGHSSSAVTHAHYTQPVALEAVRQERVLQVLEGGKGRGEDFSRGVSQERTATVSEAKK